MIFLCLVFILFLIFYIYKNLSSRSVFFLCTLTISWIVAYISFTLYLSKFNYYYDIVRQFVDFGPGTWNQLVLSNFHPEVLIRLFNLGVILFYLSFLCFAITHTSNHRPYPRLRFVYTAIAVLAAVQFLFYDPSVNLLYQNMALKHGMMSVYQRTASIGDVVFQIVNYSHILAGFVLFTSHYIRHYHLRSIRDHTLYILISLLPLTSLHLVVFYWAPANFVRTTFSSSYINYLQPSINLFLMEYKFFPLLALFSIGIMILNIYKYKSIEAKYSSINIITKKKMDTASLGVRAFTHAIKNHLLAIRSETEYLEEKFEKDEDALYSLKLIRESVEQSFESINRANDKLKQVTLNIKAVPLDRPVKKAIERIRPQMPKTDIFFTAPDSPVLVYIDDDQINEVVYNILKNASEALGEDGGEIHVHLDRADQWGAVAIRDNGPGIGAENVDEIFSPFFSTKPSITNWGIGLSFCHKVVTAHGGKIEATSEVGKYTQFDLLLPLAKRV